MKSIIISDFNIDLNRLTDYKFYFIGILGSGMSSLAGFIRMKGAQVSGSDRAYSKFSENENIPLLENSGCRLFEQNGFHVPNDANFIVVSSAVERDNPDVEKAIEFKIPVIHRTDLLSYLVNNNSSITIAGTSGKSTVTGITGYILEKSGFKPNIINGAAIKNISENKAFSSIVNNSELFVIETDESDGTIVKYISDYAVITNITKDHKTIEELIILFNEYISNTKTKLFINGDDSNIKRLNCSLCSAEIIKVGFNENNKYRIKIVSKNFDSSEFMINNMSFTINLPGTYNIFNAAMSAAVCIERGVSPDTVKKNLQNFYGVTDRYEILNDNPKIMFDYAHNPDKINSLLNHLTEFSKNILFIYQPHGFQPTYFTKNELYDIFRKYFTGKNNKILIKDIFYAGGNVTKKIDSNQIYRELSETAVNILHAPDNNYIFDYIKKNRNLYDIICVAGARDKSLKNLCYEIKKIYE